MSFVFSALAAAVTLVAAVSPPINIPGQSKGEEGRFPAPPGYLLPWAGGEIHAVTQGEETTFTHNGLTAYGFDFDLSYDTVVAARGGKVTMVREDSNRGGCNAVFSTAANYVVIDHGDGTSALYLHLAYNGATVATGDIVAQGDPIAVSGETGLTCADAESESDAPGAHLHFQVQRTEENRPLSQSVPIAFDDIDSYRGVPQTGRSYVSGNFGEGQPQKIKLTEWRVQRVFNPTARPANPHLVEDALAPTPTPEPAPPAPEPPPAEWPTAVPTEEPTRTPVPDDTPVPVPHETPTAPVSSPTTAPEPTPVPDSPTPEQSETPAPPTAVPTTEPPTAEPTP